MIRNLALALTIAAVSTGAAAQSSPKPTWDDLLKPYQAKTNPNVPLAPTQPAIVATPPASLILDLERFSETARSTGNTDIDATMAEYHRVMQNACEHLVGVQGARAVSRCVAHNTIR